MPGTLCPVLFKRPACHAVLSICATCVKKTSPVLNDAACKTSIKQIVYTMRVALLAVLLFAPACLAVRETKFYDVLGVAPDADDRTLKKAYKKQAL